MREEVELTGWLRAGRPHGSRHPGLRIRCHSRTHQSLFQPHPFLQNYHQRAQRRQCGELPLHLRGVQVASLVSVAVADKDAGEVRCEAETVLRLALVEVGSDRDDCCTAERHLEVS